MNSDFIHLPRKTWEFGAGGGGGMVEGEWMQSFWHLFLPYKFKPLIIINSCTIEQHTKGSNCSSQQRLHARYDPIHFPQQLWGKQMCMGYILLKRTTRNPSSELSHRLSAQGFVLQDSLWCLWSLPALALWARGHSAWGFDLLMGFKKNLKGTKKYFKKTGQEGLQPLIGHRK